MITYPDRKPATWEQAVNYILIGIVCEPPEKWANIGLSYEVLYDNDQWMALANKAWNEIEDRTNSPLPYKAITALLASKQRDYGTRNILRFGKAGLQVRLWDKIARYQNLEKRGTKPRNESVIDTLTDMIGYAVISRMLHLGWFELPLAGDQ